MAPVAVQQPVDILSSKSVFKYDNPSKSVFPDGIKTSGQCPPVAEQLAPYSAFPKEITGQTIWNPADYKNSPETWTHPFSEEEVAEMSKAADHFIASSTPLTGITKVRRVVQRID